MIDFTKLTGIEHDGKVVTQIEDSAGRVLWTGNKPVVLSVKKITDNTYAGETKYPGERFVLLNIYPTTNGTVEVTYGGLTKTITDTSGVENPNAQTVFFGTFNGVSDNVETPESGELVISGDYDTFAVGSYVQSGDKFNLSTTCSCITGVEDWGKIKSIAGNAFSNCTDLTSIIIPNRVMNIGAGAFSNCTGLTSVTISNGVTNIGASAFYGCTGLTSIIIPYTVTNIGLNAFGNCTGLTSMVVDSKNQHYFSDGAILFDKNKTIVIYCVSTASGRITIPNSVTNIGYAAFSDCTSLTSIIIPNGVTSIGGLAFQDCTGLTSITIPSNVTSIGTYAFNRCTGLTSITIPNSLTSIDGYTFQDCTGLTSITIGNSVTSIGDSAFYGCTGLTSITIPNNVTSIGKSAFYHCSNLKTIIFDNTTDWYKTQTKDATTGEWVNVSDPSSNASYLKTNVSFYWYRRA